MKKQSEDQILAACHQWLWNTYADLRGSFWHIANEREVDAYKGAVLKAKGVVAGVPDYVLNYKSKVYYFEFKTDVGELSEKQKFVHNSLLKQNFEVIIIRSEIDFKDCILNILKN